jgi:hypothetical protein
MDGLRFMVFSSVASMDLRSRSGSVGRSSVTVMQTFGAEQCRSLPGQNQVQNGIRALVLNNLHIPYLRHSPEIGPTGAQALLAKIPRNKAILPSTTVD